MKKMKKILALTACAAMLVTASVMGTIAYLTDTDNTVNNTFTVGAVEITLDEAKVNEYGEAVTPAERNTGNEYKLIPGHTYVKDPTIKVANGSESCWLFVKVENTLGDILIKENVALDKLTLENQLNSNGWKPLSDVANVYYQSWTKDDNANVVVFKNFTIKAEAEQGTSDWKEGNINVTAYAIQSDMLDTAKEAWIALNPQMP